jgi:membrane-associated protease RseP (regulator of RpoE activity)
MTYATPKRVAIITELASNRQRLYTVGDSIADPLEPKRTVQIQQIEPRRLRLRDSHTQRVLWIVEGAVVPGIPNRCFTQTALLIGLDHRYVATVAPLDPEPRFLGIRGDRALLEVDIHPPQSLMGLAPRQGERPSGLPGPGQPAPQKRDVTPFERVRVKETAPDTYEINSAEFRDALDHGGRLLAAEWPKVTPVLSMRDGVSLQVKSPVAEGILGAGGFQVTNPNLAGRAGIEVGDVILAINGQAVNSISDLFRLYLEAVRNPRLSDVEVQLERKGAPLTKTYRVR